MAFALGDHSIAIFKCQCAWLSHGRRLGNFPLCKINRKNDLTMQDSFHHPTQRRGKTVSFVSTLWEKFRSASLVSFLVSNTLRYWMLPISVHGLQLVPRRAVIVVFILLHGSRYDQDDAGRKREKGNRRLFNSANFRRQSTDSIVPCPRTETFVRSNWCLEWCAERMSPARFEKRSGNKLETACTGRRAFTSQAERDFRLAKLSSANIDRPLECPIHKFGFPCASFWIQRLLTIGRPAN